MRTVHSAARLFLVGLCVFVSITEATNYTTCLDLVRNGNYSNTTYLNGGALDNGGHPVNYSQATAIPYDFCVKECGAAPVPFDWTTFSTNFSTWLLPWLALVSQLPFGSQFRHQNVLSIFLTVGSPALAAYSLLVCVLNWAWVPRVFDGIQYPNVEHAWPILASLQHSPLHVDQEDTRYLLASLVTLPENDKYWKILAEGLVYEDTWTLAIILQIAWVVIAFILTVVDSFQDGIINPDFQSSGRGTGTLFLWLLPIVIGWQKLSPRCDYTRVRDALLRADEVFRYLREPTTDTVYTPFASSEAPPFPVPATSLGGLSSHMTHSRQPTVNMPDPEDGNSYRSPFFWVPDDDDRSASAPIYSDSRLLPWTANVELVAGAFRAAADVLPGRKLDSLDEAARLQALRAISRRISQHVRPLDWWMIVRRCITAGILSIVLHWGAIGSAIVYSFFTPTTGLGCRSGSFALYGVVGTFVWIIIVSSSFITHYAEWLEECTIATPRVELSAHHLSPRTAHRLAKFLRAFGKLVAVLNAIFIVTACIFLFSNFYTNCWCDSSVLGRGAQHAFNVIVPIDDDASRLKGAWIGSIVLSLGSVVVFIGYVYMHVEPVAPDPYARKANRPRARSGRAHFHRQVVTENKVPLLQRDEPVIRGHSLDGTYSTHSNSSYSRNEDSR
ncbi:hypothetical protein PENSPDRAFT_603094 [Peniophora sp. CONT]|nr:hypothetical protein PENSPDRAFT_603094 [Peniophora sp. CONT]